MALPKLSKFVLFFALFAVLLAGGYAVWSGLGKNVQNSVFNIPDLDREINITADISSKKQVEFAAKIAEITGILKTNSDLPDYWIELGGLRQFVGDYEGAADAWKYAAAIRPGSYVPLNNLGFLYRYQIKDYPQAENYFLQVAMVKPDLTAAWRELSDLYRYGWTEKSDKADDILLEGLEKNPENFDLLVYLAGYYRDMGEKQLAIKYFKEAMAAESENPANTAIVEELRRLEAR